MKYSVLTYNIAGYEIIHEIPEQCLNPEIEFIYVTDDHSITSSTWTVVYADDLTGTTFDKCYQIRFNPFKYVNTDVVMRIDGSMAINKDVMPLFEAFEKSGCDAAMMLHPTRNKMVEEYTAWVRMRNYPVEQANKCLSFMASNGYDVENHKGLFQYNFAIQRNNDINNRLNAETYEVLTRLATPPDTAERLDQTLGTFVINTHYPDMKIMPIGQYICFNHYFNWCLHGSDRVMVYDSRYDCTPYINNKQVTVWYI